MGKQCWPKSARYGHRGDPVPADSGLPPPHHTAFAVLRKRYMPRQNSALNNPWCMHVKDDSTPPTFIGSCLCGAVRYEVRSRIKAVTHCHCSMCRKAHGAAFGTYGSVPVDDFVVTHGAEFRRSHDSSPGVTRTFCSSCGSPLTWHSSQGDAALWISFSLGTLDTAFSPLKQRNTHLSSKASWYAIDDFSSAGGD